DPPVQKPQACCACPEIILDHIKLHSMKFPKPRELKNNEYPDLQEDEPTLLKNLMQLAKPSEGSHIDMYLDSTIKFVKEKQRKKANAVSLNNAAFGNNLYFVDITFPPSTEKFKALVDTGASNSLIHESVAEKLNINITPTTMRLSTATGSSTNAITGTTHLNFNLSPDNIIPTTFCTHFIVTTKLNNLQAIL
ncbi:MAG: retropepsin-like aspartic protease, partial [bacterium]